MSSNKVNKISTLFPKHLFWDVDMNKLSIVNDKNFIIPRALYATNSHNFESDIIKLERLYSKNEIIHSLMNTKENISNSVCDMISKKYKTKIFHRFSI